MRTNEEMRQRRQMRQEIGDGPAGQGERGVGRVGIGEAARAKDVEADEHLDVRHRPELAGLDASQDLLGRVVEEVIVVLDDVTAGLPARAATSVSSSSKVEVAGFSTMTWAPASSESMASRKCEVGGVVTWTTSGRTFSSMARWSVNQARMPYRSAAASAVAGERSQMAASSTPGKRLQAGQMLPGDLPGPDERCLHEPSSRIRR